MADLPQKGTKLIFWNVRSMWNKLDIIKQHISSSTPQFYGLSETWLKPNIPDNLINIPGYNLLRNDRQTQHLNGQNKRGGGIVIYCRNDLNFTQLTGPPFTISNEHIETIVTLFQEKMTKKCYIITLYRPPNGDVENFCEQIDNLCKSLPDRENSDLIIGGDFNINFAKNSNHKSMLNRIMKRFSLSQLIKEPTRPLYGDNIVDLIFSNSSKIESAGLLDWNVSDHVPTFVNIKKKKTIFVKDKFTGRSYRRFDEDVFLNRLRPHLTQAFMNTMNDVNEKWGHFYNSVELELNKICPIREFNFKKDKPAWLTHDLIELIKDKDHLLKKARKSKMDIDKINARQARNLVNSLIKRARSDYVKEQLDANRNDPKKFWEVIKSVFGDSNMKECLTLFDDLDNPIEAHDTSLFINNFFAQVGPNLAQHINESYGDELKQDRLDPVGYTGDYEVFEWQPFTFEDVLKQVKTIQIHKASGFPLIASKIWKLVFIEFVEILTHILNCSMTSGLCPDRWKTGTIIPIPKVTNPTKIGELRPISLLPLTSKIIEHLIHSQLSCFIERNNILSKFQNGFRPKRSTIQTVFDYTTDLHLINNSNRDTLALYIDYQKAFDTVNHDRLIKKCRELKFGNQLCTWLDSYLSNRSQKTFANNVISPSAVVTYGVPQGSVLGPLLFILYLNDIVECVKNCKYFMYADDIVIYKDIDTLTNPHCIDDLQSDLNRIVTWCRLNELTINVKKTKAQFFPRNRNLDLLAFKDDHALTIDNVNVGYMDTFRYLGVEIQSDLLFKAHINRLNKNASHKLFLLRRLRNVLTNQASILVLKSMFLGVLDYGLLFVSNVPVKMFDDLQTIQNHALRAVLNIQDPQDLNIVEMHDLIHVKMLRHRMLIQLLMCMRNAFINQSLSIISRNVVTRGNDGATFDLPVPRIKLLRKCPFYLGTLIWNQLPYNIRVTDFKPAFKSFITKGIIHNTIRTVFQD